MTGENEIIANIQDCEQETKGIDEEKDATIMEEVKSLVSNSWPVVVSGSIGMYFSVICLIAVGRTGEEELAGTGFGIMFCNMTGYSVMIGIASGLETVASQLYGAGQHRLLGVALQRTMFVTSILAVPIALFWLFAGLILPIFVEEDVARISGSFVRISCLGLWPYLINECVKRYLNAQGFFLPAMYSSLAALLLYSPLCWYLVDTLGMGATGGALALGAANALSLALLLAYVRLRALHVDTWGGWSRDALRGAPAFLRIALPSCGMICLEWWCFEIVTLASGRLGTTAVAAQAVMFNTNAVAYMVGLGFAVAAGARVGNLLGAGRPAAARRAALLAWGTCVAIMLVVSLGLYVGRRQWAGLFTQDAGVVETILGVMPIQVSFVVFDSSNAVLCGVVRGCGQQQVGFVVSMVAFYALALPLGIGLAFHAGMGLPGLWYGLAAGSVTQSLGLSAYLATVSWEGLAARARRRVESFSAAGSGGGGGGNGDAECGAGGGRVALATLDDLSCADGLGAAGARAATAG